MEQIGESSLKCVFASMMQLYRRNLDIHQCFE